MPGVWTRRRWACYLIPRLSNKGSKTGRIQVRMVWRLVWCLFGHITLLIFLALYLVVSLNSVRLYAPAANAEEIQMESLHAVPALLEAMDAERHVWQKSGDPRDRDSYFQMRQTVQNNLVSLNTPLLLPSERENQRRTLVRRWIAEIGDAAINHAPGKPGEADLLSTSSRVLLDQLNLVTGQVEVEVQTALAGLKAQEVDETNGRVSLMWTVVFTVIAVTILIQLLLANSIIGPIQALGTVVKRLQSGDYTARAHLRSGDEIESLGETFNAMAENIVLNQQELQEKNERLSVQQEALRNANVGLEERVAEKTHELEDKNQKLNEAARLKDEFLATLSHELRTPLTPVISCAHLLGTDFKLDSDQQKNVQIIDRNARALSRMIDELLDLSSVMNRKLRLVREQTEMNEWTRATLETQRPAWEKKGLTLTFLPEGKPVQLQIDPTRLAQVLTNLITNAVKYTDSRGKIAVKLVASKEEVRIAVTDTGVGLTQQEIKQIFEMFHQSRTRRTQSVGGLGVGLTVARSLAELHGGGLLAESPGPGQGATFTLWLPRRINLTTSQTVDISPSARATPPSDLDRKILKGKRMLLVEDSEDTREKLQRILQRRECVVMVAASGEEALELARRDPPEIIISDIGLPGISGLEFMTQWRAQSGGRKVVAIALSGLGREQDIQGAAQAGFDVHLLKPVDIATLDETLIRALSKREGQPPA